MNHKDLLERLGACVEAQRWYDGRDSREAWEVCERGDWLLWVAARLGVDRKLLVLAACDCADSALRHVPDGEDRPRKAIEAARAWCLGEASINEVRAAAHAACAAYAADAAACAAARAAACAAHAAACAAHAAHAAAYAADARTQSLAASADIVRRHMMPWTVIESAIENFLEKEMKK